MTNFPLLSSGSPDAPTPVPALVAQIEVERTRLRFRGLHFVPRAVDQCSPDALRDLDALADALRLARTKDRAELISLKQLHAALELGELSRLKLALQSYTTLMRWHGDESVFVRKCGQLAEEL